MTLAQSHAGQWWWWSPRTASAHVVAGVQGVDATVGAEPADRQVQRWGFNLLMPPTAPAFLRKGGDHCLDLALSLNGPNLVREEGVALPDVFDSSWAEAVEQRINGIEPVAGLVGWSGDGAWRWGGWAAPGEALPRPGLLQVCLSLDPAFRAYHSAWDFVLARHGGKLAEVAATWGVELAGRGAARQMTREERIIDSPGYRRDLDDFIKEYALRYLSVIRRAARQINPDCLVLSPLLTGATPPLVREMAASQCDLLQVDGLGLVTADAPQLWLVPEWVGSNGGVDLASGEGEYERRIREGRASIGAGLRDPRVIGYVWTRFRRGDLVVDSPFDVGLVDENGRRNDALVEPLRSLNAVADQLRAAAAPAPEA